MKELLLLAVFIGIMLVGCKKDNEDKIYGNGTSADPYKIGTAAALVKMAEYINTGDTAYNNKYYILTTDIDLKRNNWIPIGTKDNSFNGYFDGNKHKITGLFISNNNIDYVGLFGNIAGGSVRDLVVEVYFVCNSFVGGVAAGIYNSEITNCTVIGEIKGNWYVGSVAGIVDNSEITNCTATGERKGNWYVGGVAGIVDNGGSITNCYTTGAVDGISRIGGVAGAICNSGSITNCYATGEVRGSIYVGGVVGYVSSGNITNCAALIPSIQCVSISNHDHGRVAGYNEGGTFTNNVAWDGMAYTPDINFPATTPFPTSGDTDLHGSDINTTAAKNQSTYTGLGWGFAVNGAGPWKMGGGVYQLPVFYWQNPTIPTPTHLQ